MAIETAEDFAAVLEKSGLLTDEQIADARLAAEGADEPRSAAKGLVERGLLTRWQAGQLLAGRSSFFLGKYKLIEPIGRGGMGGVFLGQHTTMNRRVALKILSRQVGRDPASLERFLDEARAIACLDHPNIVQAYSVDHDADRYYLVMEYIDGRDLKQLVEVEGLPDYETAADYIRQAADGLAHGHSRNMIHCDIKPSNLLVSNQGMVKIVDMGLARLDGHDQEEVNGQGEGILGSVDYLAPEQGLESADFDHRADVYSLGCTLYFLLTGHPPFPEGTLPERIVKHQMQQPQSIRQQRPDAPTDLVGICEKMMAKRAEDRFQSAEDVSRVLAQWHLPQPQQKHIVPLKTAQPLDAPDGQRIPEIDVDAGRKSTAAQCGHGRLSAPGRLGAHGRLANSKDPPKKAGVFQTRRQKIAAVVVGGLAVAAVAAAVAALLSGNAPVPAQGERPQAVPAPAGVEEHESPGERTIVPDQPRGDLHEPPSDKPPSDKPPADEPPTDKPPADEPKDQPRQIDEPQPDKPANKRPRKEPKKQRKKPQQPDKPDPFRRLATAVDLPVLRASSGSGGQSVEPVSLGELDLEGEAACAIELRSSLDTVPGKRHFAMDRGPSGESWLIHLDSDAQQGSQVRRTDLARIRLDQQTLKFQWIEGVGPARGDYLRNCGLLVRVGQQSHWLPLCQPKMVEPPVLDLEGGLARVSLPTTQRMPKAGRLRLQVTALEGPFSEHGFRPVNGISEDGRVEVFLSGADLPNVRLRVRLVGRGRAASVQVTAVYQLADLVERKLKIEEVVRLARESYALQGLTEQTRDKLKNKDPRRSELQRQIELLEDAQDQLKALVGMYRRIHKIGKVHFRVFHTIDDREIDLFVTNKGTPEDGDKHEQAEKD